MIVTTKSKLRNKTQRSARGHIIALVDYLLKNQDRVKDIWVSPEIGTMDRVEIKGAFMATASMNSRARNPMKHFILSWRPEEQVSHQERQKMIERFMSAIGGEGHQWIAVQHSDTDMEHLHIALSSIHPETFQANQFPHSQLKMMKVKAEIERERGWDQLDYPEFKNAPFRAAEDGKIEDRRGKRGQAFARAGTLAKERYHSGMSMESYLNETFVSVLGKNHNSMKGWKAEELHEVLGAMGLEMRKQGGGAILIWHHQNETGEVIQERRKLSAVEGWKFAKLQKVLDGGFQEAQKDYVQPVGFQHSPTNPATQTQYQKDIQEVQKQIAPAQTKIKKRHLSQAVIAWNNTPAVMAETCTDAAYISRTKSIQAKRKLERQKKIDAERKANAEFLRRQSERLRHEEEDARQRELEHIERIQIEKEREVEAQKAPATPDTTPVHTGVVTEETGVGPTDQYPTWEDIGLNVQEQDVTPEHLRGDQRIFIDLLREGQFDNAMDYATNVMNFSDRQEYLDMVPEWWYQATGTEIPEDWLSYYGPPEDRELMYDEPEEEEGIWR